MTEAGAAPEAGAATPASAIRQLGGALLVYLMLAFIFTWSTWNDPSHHWIGICCDQQQSMWFLAWPPTALGLGQTPLLTDHLNAPAGANLMWNGSSPLIGLVLAPLTSTVGPILSYNLAVVAAIALSGLAAFAALRRYTRGSLGPLVAGALYAFSPFVASHTTLHLQLVNVWAAPLFLLIVDELVVGRRSRPVMLGIALGVVAAMQLVTFEELLATSAVAATLLVLLVALVVHERSAILASTRRLVRAAIPAMVTFALLAAYPLAVQFLGPQQLHGAVQDTRTFSTDLLNLILPTPYELLAPNSVTTISRHFSGLYHEATGYIGLPLLAVLAWVVVARRQDRRVLVAGIMVVLLFVLSLGPELHVGGESWHVAMPWQPIGKLPLLEHALPARLTLYMWLAVTVIVAIAIDRAAALDLRQGGVRLAAIGLALVFVVPAPAASSSASVPSFFRTWQQQDIPDDQIVLVAPWFTNGAGADPMLWAAVAQARPRMYEGYVYVPAADGRPRYGPPAGALALLMIDVQDHGVTIALTDAMRAAAIQELRDAHISVVIVGPLRYRAQMVALFTDLLGRAPSETDGVELWRDVQQAIAR